MCNHPDPALCQRLRMHVHGHLWEIWTGTGRYADRKELCERYRQSWEANAATLPTLEEQRRRAIAKHRPGWWKRFLRFLSALWHHVRHGLPTASPEDQAKRWAICEPCEWRDKEKDRCVQCGCHLPPGQMFSKIRWAGEQCPLLGNRPGPWWGPVKGETIGARAWRWLTGKRGLPAT